MEKCNYLIKNSSEFFIENNNENLRNLKRILIKWIAEIKKIKFCLVYLETDLIVEAREYNILSLFFIYV
jgi:hypothetical protein